MTTKELIRQEIERRYAYQKEMYNKTKPDGRPNDGWAESLAIMGELEEFLSFLDSLPDEPVMDCHELTEAAENSWAVYEYRESPKGLYSTCYVDGFIAGAEWQKRKQPKVKGYGVMRKMEDPHPDDWYMDERGKEHCWGYKFNEPCPWPAEVYIMEAKEDADD